MSLALASLFILPARGMADRPDGWITAKVKLRLMTARQVNATDLNVDTIDRRVTLHGTLASAELRDRATAIASAVEGVREVRSLIQVVPERRRAAVRRTDWTTQDRVTVALDDDPLLATEHVGVRSVNDGLVLLSGRVSSTELHEHALRVARSVPGVRAVASQIEGPNDTTNLIIWRGSGSGGFPRQASAWDSLTTTRVKLALLAETSVPGFDINVDTSGGMVTLFGMVGSDAAKASATEVATAVPGVLSVKNELQVVPGSRRDDVRGRDRVVQAGAEARLEREPLLDDTDVSVEVHDGVARLTGDVENEDQLLAALVAVGLTPGVTRVIDELTLSG